MSCLKILEADSPDYEIVLYLSNCDHFDLNGAYYAMKCLELAGAEVQFQEGMLRWRYDENEQAKPCSIPPTPLIRYFKYDVYGMYGSSIFSSPLSVVLKRIELGEPKPGPSLTNSLYALLRASSQQDIMIMYMALEIVKAIDVQGYSSSLPYLEAEHIKAFLRRCTTRKGYVANPTTSSISLESTYAGHKIAQHLGIPDPKGIGFFIDSLQNENGGFRRTLFGGISTLESCYLALNTIADYSLIDLRIARNEGGRDNVL